MHSLDRLTPSVTCSAIMMQSGRSKCICNFESCRRHGGKATVRVPVIDRDAWLTAVGLHRASHVGTDPRVSLVHFTASNIEASTDGSGPGGACVVVRPVKGALPSQSNSEIEAAARFALPKFLRALAENERHRGALAKARSTREALETRIQELQGKVQEVGAKRRKRAKAAEEPKEESQPCAREIDFRILEGLSIELSTNLCGLKSFLALEKFYSFLNHEGAADNIVFYAGADTTDGIKEDGRRIVQRKKKLGGVNGVFFLLFVLRTGSTLRLSSTLFGVSESTGGRAFTTWLNFLHLSLQPVVHLPAARNVVQSAPGNFKLRDLGSVAIVLDATEIPLDKVWHTDAAHATFSNYKGKTTGKILLGITPAGAICFISDVFGGRITDGDLIKQSGIIDKLVGEGFGGKGYHVMADRGFNGMAQLLMAAGMNYVAPPSKRKDEKQFARDDAKITRDVANLRIHVERAIGAVKQWRFLDRKVDSQQMDNIGLCVQVCGALVVLIHPPFATKD